MSNPFANYGSKERMEPWYNTSKYYSSNCWLENKRLKKLRPSLETLIGQKDLVGAEIGVGRCINSINILDHLDIKELHLIDLNTPVGDISEEVLSDKRVTFYRGDSLQLSHTLPDNLDFVYLDASHDYNYILNELRIILPKLKIGGLIGGHDFEQIGVTTSVMTLMCNLWRHFQTKPVINIESCMDEHPGYPEEYLKIGFPLDWWYVKEEGLDDFIIYDLRNG